MLSANKDQCSQDLFGEIHQVVGGDHGVVSSTARELDVRYCEESDVQELEASTLNLR